VRFHITESKQGSAINRSRASSRKQFSYLELPSTSSDRRKFATRRSNISSVLPQFSCSFLMETDIMRAANEIRLDNSTLKSNDYDALIMFSYVFFAVTLLVIIYAASMSSGTPSGEFALMSAFP
jgi:hypothetical protein